MNEMYYASDVGHYLVKDSNSNMYPAKVSRHKEYGSNADMIKIEGKTYYIGDGEYEINVQKYNKSNYIPLLLAGIAKSTKEPYVTVKLAVGLPLNQYKTCKNELIDLLEETKYSIVFNSEPRIIEITTVEVYPEGISAYQHIVDKYVDEIGNRDIVIVDIGGGTTDICLIRDYVAMKPTSLNIGSIHFYDAIKKAIEVKFIDVKIDLEKVRDYVLNGFWYEGEEQDISFAINASEYLFEKIYNELKLNYPITTEKVFLIGGGSELLAETFKDSIADLVVIDDLFANAKGYLELLEGE